MSRIQMPGGMMPRLLSPEEQEAIKDEQAQRKDNAVLNLATQLFKDNFKSDEHTMYTAESLSKICLEAAKIHSRIIQEEALAMEKRYNESKRTDSR